MEKEEKKKSFWSDKKNVAIVILSIITFCYIFGSTEETIASNTETISTSANAVEYENTIETLNAEKANLENQITTLTSEKGELQNQVYILTTEKGELENQVTTLTTEKEDLEEQLASAKSSAKTRTTTASSSSSTATASSPTTTTSYTVYVTNTGSKYHSSGCSYLRQSQIAKDKATAITEGYSACSRCNP